MNASWTETLSLVLSELSLPAQSELSCDISYLNEDTGTYGSADYVLTSDDGEAV